MENQDQSAEKSTLAFELIELKPDSYNHLEPDNLVGELQRLLINAPVEKIGKHVSQIKRVFDTKLKELKEKEKEAFLANDGNEIDFHFQSKSAKDFQELYREYRQKKEAFRINFERQIQQNLQTKQEIIEEIKSLISTEENINTTFSQFRDLQTKWRETGPVPKTENDNLWANYHHHVERFYDFLDLNRELRDKDFKHNYDEKIKIVERAEALINEDDFQQAYNELQQLHRIWKEELGPVSKEHRAGIWERFSNATKVMHDKRQEFQKKRDEEIQTRLTQKKELLEDFKREAATIANSHQGIQAQFKKLVAIRESFYQIEGVPYSLQKSLIAELKKQFGQFSKAKNDFYKNQKKEQKSRITQKKELIAKAESLKDSDNFDETTPLFIALQKDWKAIGPVPRKIGDPLWKTFKATCNYYFDRLHGNAKVSKQKQSPLDKVFNERSHLKKQMEEVMAEIRQLENNLEFFNSDDTSNPLIASVLKNIDKKKLELDKLQEQLKKLNVERNKLQKEQEEAAAAEESIEAEEEKSED